MQMKTPVFEHEERKFMQHNGTLELHIAWLKFQRELSKSKAFAVMENICLYLSRQINRIKM